MAVVRPLHDSSKEETVCAVVVTHNRRDLLRECLDAIAEQRRSVHEVVVVDNASTDGTEEMVRACFPQVRLHRLEVNLGGAGGFHEGMRRGHDLGHDWMWLMDDDTIPDPEALARLLAPLDELGPLRRPMLLASRVDWVDGRLHPMNAPGPERKRIAHLVEASERGLFAIRSATFVSLLVARVAIDRYGLPHKHFFIWSDDIEYTARVLREEDGYLVPDSRVVHKTKAAHTAVTDAGDRFYYHVRNTLYMLRGDTWDFREKLTLVYILLVDTARYLRRHRFAPDRSKLVMRATRHGLRRRPELRSASA